MDNRRIIDICLCLVVALSVLGIALASYQTYKHYTLGPSFCDVNEVISCDVVNRSSYSEVFGVPVALLGAIGYFAFLVLSLLLIRDIDFSKFHKTLRTRDVYYFVFLLVAAGFMFSMYLTYIELYVLHAICPLCVVSALMITTILILSVTALVCFVKYEKNQKLS